MPPFATEQYNSSTRPVLLFCIQGAFISWLDDELAVPAEGLLVHGLFIDAGRWDMRNMALTDPALGEAP